MKRIVTVSACKGYAILSHEDAREFDVVNKRVLSREPLKCSLGRKDLRYRDKSEKLDNSLSIAFGAACRGANARWKLVSIEIEPAAFVMGFADLDSMTENGDYVKRDIVFPLADIEFRVTAKRDGAKLPDEYSIEIFKDGAWRSDYGTTIAKVTEFRDGQIYEVDEFFLRNLDFTIRRIQYD